MVRYISSLLLLSHLFLLISSFLHTFVTSLSFFSHIHSLYLLASDFIFAIFIMYTSQSIFALALLALSPLVSAHGKITSATGDLGGKGQGLGVVAGQDQSQADVTVFQNGVFGSTQTVRPSHIDQFVVWDTDKNRMELLIPTRISLP